MPLQVGAAGGKKRVLSASSVVLWLLGSAAVLTNCGKTVDLGGGARAPGDAGSAGELEAPSSGGKAGIGGTSAGPGTGGTTSTGGDARETADAGRGGPGGRAAQAGASDEAGQTGQAGAGPEPFEGVDCHGEPMELDPEWVRYCTVLAACTPTLEEDLPGGASYTGLDLAECLSTVKSLWSFRFFGDEQGTNLRAGHPDFKVNFVACPNSLDDCEDVLACSGKSRDVPACANDASSRCDGDLAINCGEENHVSNCARLTGLSNSCQLVGGKAVCVVAPTCAAPNTDSCDGTKVVHCADNGIGYGKDCAQFGLTCVLEADRALCLPPLPTETCTERGTAKCVDGVRRYCSPDGISFESPACNSVGDLACSLGGADNNGEYYVECMPQGCAADFYSIYNDDVSCEGNDYVNENGNRKLRVSCPANGFATCTDSSGYAHCTN
jgi:hypothetical protein